MVIQAPLFCLENQTLPMVWAFFMVSIIVFHFQPEFGVSYFCVFFNLIIVIE